MTARFSSAIDQDVLHLDPVRVGRVRSRLPTPDRYVTALDSERPILRVDVYSYGPDAFTFEEAVLWRGLVIIGYGSHVHAISVADRSAYTIELGSYFGRLHPTTDFLLIASGERLFRMEPDRSIRWRSDLLGIDGVIVQDVGSSIIRGTGEWDPPGGRKPFALSVSDGLPVAI